MFKPMSVICDNVFARSPLSLYASETHADEEPDELVRLLVGAYAALWGETQQNFPFEMRDPPLDGVRPFPAPQYASAADGARCRRASRRAQAPPNRPLAARHQPNDGRGSQSPTVHAGTERQMLNWGWRDARATLIRRV